MVTTFESLFSIAYGIVTRLDALTFWLIGVTVVIVLFVFFIALLVLKIKRLNNEISVVKERLDKHKFKFNPELKKKPDGAVQ